jgi:hypothetical protein
VLLSGPGGWGGGVAECWQRQVSLLYYKGVAGGAGGRPSVCAKANKSKSRCLISGEVRMTAVVVLTTLDTVLYLYLYILVIGRRGEERSGVVCIHTHTS